MIRRAKLPRAQYDALLERQGYACASWGCANPGPYQADHKQALCLGGDNGASNWQLLCSACHKAKSAEEVARKSKADRQGGRKGQYARRQQRGPLLKSARKLLGRGFDKLLRKKMDGTVEPRR